jgi:ribosomal protein L37AE/L43A
MQRGKKKSINANDERAMQVINTTTNNNNNNNNNSRNVSSNVSMNTMNNENCPHCQKRHLYHDKCWKISKCPHCGLFGHNPERCRNKDLRNTNNQRPSNNNLSNSNNNNTNGKKKKSKKSNNANADSRQVSLEQKLFFSKER